MSKRVQFAHSYPIVTATPSPEAGRMVEYYKADGMYYMMPNGTSIGPISTGGTVGPDVVKSSTATANKVTVAPLASPPSSPSDGDQWIVKDYAGSALGVPAPGTLIDLAESSLIFNVPSTTVTFVDGMVVVVPPQVTPYELSFSGTSVLTTGTSAIGSFQSIMVFLLDQITGFPIGFGAASAGQITAASKAWQASIAISRVLPPTSVTRYFRIYARLANAIPASWTSSTLYAENAPDSGNYPPMQLKAVTA